MTRVVMINNDRDYFLHHRRPVAERLVALGAELTVISGGRPHRSGEDAGWSSIHMPFDRLSVGPIGNLRLFRTAFGHIRRLRPDSLHLLTLKPAVFGGFAAVLARLGGGGPERILVTIPGLGRLMSPGGTGAGRASGLARGVVGSAIRFLSNRRGVTFSFENARDREIWIEGGLIRADNSTVIKGAGCDPALFYPDPVPQPRQRVRVLFASRLLRSKGLDAFVETARRLGSRPDVEFIVAGMNDPDDPDDYPAAELQAETSITFLGAVGDMPALLRSVDLVVLPTRYGEGIPRILIEAAATGLPSIATDIAGCREIIEDGVSGFLVPADDLPGLPDALTRATLAYLDDRQKLGAHGQAALQRFRAGGFSAEAVVARFVALILGKNADRSGS